MGIAERRSREKAELRGEILRAARELFARDGYAAVSMRQIAEAIEYSPTAIYLHFTDKQTLIRELVREDFAALAGAFSRIGRIADPVERLRRIGIGYADFALKYPNHYKLMFMTPNPRDDPGHREARGDPDRDAYEFLRRAVAEAMRARVFRPQVANVDLIAQTLWACVHGVVSLEIVKHDDPWIAWRPVRQRVRTMVDAVMGGLLR